MVAQKAATKKDTSPVLGSFSQSPSASFPSAPTDLEHYARTGLEYHGLPQNNYSNDTSPALNSVSRSPSASFPPLSTVPEYHPLPQNNYSWDTCPALESASRSTSASSLPTPTGPEQHGVPQNDYFIKQEEDSDLPTQATNHDESQSIEESDFDDGPLDPFSFFNDAYIDPTLR